MEYRMPKKFGETGCWTEQEYTDFFDWELADGMQAILKGKTVVDVGCGKGRYVKYLNDSGAVAKGYDGNPHTSSFNEDCEVFDFTTQVSCDKVFDWAICLEVAEHIPRRFEGIFISNLLRLCKDGIIISWAHVGQTGIGHVNEKDPQDVKQIFFENEMSFCEDATRTLREMAHIWWFKRNVMVFSKGNLGL